jgi:hypothetical protein
MSSLASAEGMSPPVSPTPAPSVAPRPASPESHTLVARCGHYIFNTASTSTNSLDIEFCPGCELRAAVSFAANSRTAEDPDAAYEGLVAWRKARLDLANFEFETEGTDGCSAGYDFTPEQHEKFCRDVALRLVEGEDAEELKAEMEADEAEERAATTAPAAMEAGMGSTTTTTTGDAQIANTNTLTTASNTTYAVNSALKGARAGRTLSPPTNNTKRKRSRSVTHANSADVYGDEGSHAHRDEDSYRSSSVYSRHNHNKGSRVYVRGRWAAPPRSSWLDTSGCDVSYDKWERDARDLNHKPRRTRSMAREL